MPLECQEMPPHHFKELRDQILRPVELGWNEIPWQLSLSEAIQQAVQKNRPLFIWAMDGHPLGCTCNNGIVDRVLVYSDPMIVEMMNASFVPVALNASALKSESSRDLDLFRNIVEQGHFARRTKPTNTRQGIYIARADGRLLASANFRDVQEILNVMREAIDKFGDLTSATFTEDLATTSHLAARERHCLDHGLVLRVYMRDLEEAVDNDWQYNLDYIWFHKSELNQLLPPHPVPGSIVTVPQSMIRKLVRFHLRDTVRGECVAWKDSEVRVADMAFSVLEMKGQKVIMSISGQVAAASAPTFEVNPYSQDVVDVERGIELTLSGHVCYNLLSRRFERFDMIATGLRWGADLYNFRFDMKAPSAIGFVFEMVTAEDRLPIPGVRWSGTYFSGWASG